MKGNAKSNGRARTQQINPDSQPAQGRRKTKGPRPMTKRQAKLARRVKDYERTYTMTNERGRCTDSAKHHDVHKPGSLSK